MTMLDHNSIKAPTLRKQTATVPELGGDVVVRGLLLSERFALFEGINDAGAKHVQMARLLSMAVVDAKDQSLMSERQWDIFGAEHFGPMKALFDIAKTLSGLDVEVVEKN